METDGTVEELELDNESEDDDVVEDELVVVMKVVDDAVLDGLVGVSLVWGEELDKDVLVELTALALEIEVNETLAAALDESDAEESIDVDRLIDDVDIEIVDTKPEDVWEKERRKEVDEDEDVPVLLVSFVVRATANNTAVARE